MKQYSVLFYVDRDDETEIELEVTGTVSPYVPAITHRLPEDCSPSEGGEVEITSIKDRGMAWRGELTPSEIEAVEDLLFDAAQDDVDEPEWDDLDSQEWDDE